MDAQKIKKALKKVAKNHGVSVAEVRREIELASKVAQADPNPQVQAKNRTLPSGWVRISCISRLLLLFFRFFLLLNRTGQHNVQDNPKNNRNGYAEAVDWDVCTAYGEGNRGAEAEA